MPRVADYTIHELFIARHSPRAISDKHVEKEVLMSLFEAARWAPSSYNNQPWRYVYAYKGSPVWQALQDFLVPQNRRWACNAPIIMAVISHNLFAFNNKPARTHSFDTGASWQNLALQATYMGLVAHAMEGFDYEGVHSYLSLTGAYSVEAMVAVGYPGDRSLLPPDLQKSDSELSGRMAVSSVAFEDGFHLP